jgi:hypothetical protein
MADLENYGISPGLLRNDNIVDVFQAAVDRIAKRVERRKSQQSVESIWAMHIQHIRDGEIFDGPFNPATDGPYISTKPIRLVMDNKPITEADLTWRVQQAFVRYCDIIDVKKSTLPKFSSRLGALKFKLRKLVMRIL